MTKHFGRRARQLHEHKSVIAHTLRQHAFVSDSKLETVGQIYLGLPPDFPLIAF